MVSFCVYKCPGGTFRCPGVFSGLAIHAETKPFSMFIEIKYYMYNTQLLDAF